MASSNGLTAKENSVVDVGVKRYIEALFRWPNRWVSVCDAVNPFHCFDLKAVIWGRTKHALKLMGVSFIHDVSGLYIKVYS